MNKARSAPEPAILRRAATTSRCPCPRPRASLRVVTSAWTDHFAAFPSDWEDVMATVQRELVRRHGDDPRWQAAQEQSSRIGSLLAAGEVRGRMLVLQPV